MTNPLIEQQIITQLQQLDEERQKQVLDFACSLAIKKPIGVPGEELLHLAGTISQEDAKLMLAAIEEGCERIDINEW